MSEFVEKLRKQRRKEKLAREYSHMPQDSISNPIGDALTLWGRGVKERVSHPLQTLANEANRWRGMNPETMTSEVAGMLNPAAGLVGAIAKGGKLAALANKTEFELAHEIAQRNAALPVEQGGLGLPPNNTAMDRAKAMGFDTPVYHGTKGDISEFDKSTTGMSTNTRGVARQGISVTNDPKVASDYAIHADVRAKKLWLDEQKKKELQKRKLTKLQADMYAGKIKKNEYESIASEAYNADVLRELANSPGFTGFGYNTQIAKNDANVMPLLISGDISKVSPSTWNQKILREGLKSTTEPVTFQNVPDVIEGLTGAGYLHDTTIIQKPNQIRSRFAAFDPMQRNSANLLAGGAAGAVGLTSLADLMRQQEEYQ